MPLHQSDKQDLSDFYKNKNFVKITDKKLPFKDNEFDLAISLGCFHNLRIFELKTALSEMQRVGKQGYLMLESYRSEKELFWA